MMSVLFLAHWKQGDNWSVLLYNLGLVVDLERWGCAIPASVGLEGIALLFNISL